MAIWKQAVLCLVLFIGVLAAWVHFDAGASETLKRYGIDNPLIAALAPSTAGQAERQAASSTGAGAASAGFGRPSLVVTRKVGQSTLNDRLKAIGSGMAIRTVTVTPTTSGTLQEVLVQSGDHVEAGQVIATLDAEEQRIAADRAKLTLADAEKKLARYQELRNSAAVTSVQISDMESEVAANKLALQQAQFDLGKRTIRTPIPGVVGIVRINIGDYVTSETQIVTIDDRSAILVDFQVPERFSGAITIGSPVTATASAFPGKTFQGDVSAIDNRIDPDSRTLRVRARIPNENDLLRAGMSFFVEMRFPGDKYPAVNPLAVQWDSSGAYVWKVVDNKAERVSVAIVQRNSDTVLVNGKIDAGDAVVTQGVQVLRPGSEVRFADSEDGAEDEGGSDDGNKSAARPQINGGASDDGTVRKAEAKRAAAL